MTQNAATPMVLIVMGVSGSGKSTIGALLSERLGARFADADDFHPPANVAKMSSGLPLDDADRAPWLDSLRREIDLALVNGERLVLACSALRSNYRDVLRVDASRVLFIYLKGSQSLIAERTAERTHFMPPSLLASQFASLEEPVDALVVDIVPPPDAVVQQILDALSAPTA